MLCHLSIEITCNSSRRWFFCPLSSTFDARQRYPLRTRISQIGTATGMAFGDRPCLHHACWKADEMTNKAMHRCCPTGEAGRRNPNGSLALARQATSKSTSSSPYASAATTQNKRSREQRGAAALPRLDAASVRTPCALHGSSSARPTPLRYARRAGTAAKWCRVPDPLRRAGATERVCFDCAGLKRVPSGDFCYLCDRRPLSASTAAAAATGGGGENDEGRRRRRRGGQQRGGGGGPASTSKNPAAAVTK